jgi:hypothetical protein
MVPSVDPESTITISRQKSTLSMHGPIASRSFWQMMKTDTGTAAARAGFVSLSKVPDMFGQLPVDRMAAPASALQQIAAML